MTETTQSRPRVKPERSCRVSPDRGIPGARRVLSLYIGKEAFLYWVKPIPADWGRGFELENWENGEVYHVHLDEVNGHSCTCLGHLRWGHRHPCKHVGALTELVKRGRV